ncbi:hypothetical protein N657DRAFT_663537 [Parathielavia appendiculata]|uniref:Uncharacterized protein n=1 Tax=Parathielavia appendiculata TaxID=2587402 RepID=A0AAN6U3L1_9PEZI|nr:hypothetical protein N657DRAFT_663537 [Parathielavia appendiculata]
MQPELAPYDGLEVVPGSARKLAIASKMKSYHRQLDSGDSWQQEKTPAGTREALPARNRICGLSRAIFRLTVVSTVLSLLAFSTAVSSLSPPTTQTSPTSALTISPPASRSIASSSTSTLNSNSTTSTSTPRPSNICPGANNTVVTPTLGTVQYSVMCDSDFSGSGKQDLASYVTTSFDECTELMWRAPAPRRPTCWCLGGADKTVVKNVGNIVGVPQRSEACFVW